MPAIWSLKAAINYIKPRLSEINERETRLSQYFLDGLSNLDNVMVYNKDRKRVATICFIIKNLPTSDVVAILDKNNICVRGGIHCAILAHETLGTVETGAVRASLNYMNTEGEIDTFLSVLKGMG